MITISATTLVSLFWGMGMLLVFGPIAWIIRKLIADVKESSREITDLRNHLISNYVTKEDYQRDIAEIKQIIREGLASVANANVREY